MDLLWHWICFSDLVKSQFSWHLACKGFTAKPVSHVPSLLNPLKDKENFKSQREEEETVRTKNSMHGCSMYYLFCHFLRRRPSYHPSILRAAPQLLANSSPLGHPDTGYD
ncbi:unnamed protein product [Boreogadus saida]